MVLLSCLWLAAATSPARPVEIRPEPSSRPTNDDEPTPYETVVRGKRTDREVEKRVLTREELVKMPGAFGDPLRAAQSLPGMGRSPFGLGALVIRGADPADSAYVIDGVHFDYLYHFGALAAVLPEPLVDKISFHPSSFGARYGRATGGIIEVQTTQPEPRTLRLKGSVDLVQAAAYAAIPLGERTTLTLAVRRSYVDAILPALLPALIARAPTLLPAYYDYQLRLTHTSARLGELTVAAYGAHDVLGLTQEDSKSTGVLNPSELRFENGFVSLQPRWTWSPSARVTNELSLFGAFRYIDVRTPETRYARNDWQLGGREELSIKAAQSVTVRAGIDAFARTLDFRARLPFEPPVELFPSPLSLSLPLEDHRYRGAAYDVAFYTESEIRLGNLRLVPGLRLALIGTEARALQSLQPRLGAQYALGASLKLKAGVGLYQKQSDAPGLIPGRGDPRHPLQSAVHSSLGVEWQPLPWLFLDLVAFFNYLWDHPESSNTLLALSLQPLPVSYRSDQEGRVVGAQVQLRSRPYRGFFGWVSYTLSRSERRDAAGWRLFAFDQTHLLTLVASYKLPYGFQIGARFRLTSGNPYTPVTRALFDGDTGTYQPIFGPTASARLPLFHQLDVRLDKVFVFDRWQLGLYLDVQNVYAQRNVELQQYSYDYRTLGYVHGLPILPVLGIEGSY